MLGYFLAFVLLQKVTGTANFEVVLALRAGHVFLPHKFAVFGDGIAGAKECEKRLFPLLKNFPCSQVALAFRVVRRGGHKAREHTRSHCVFAAGKGRVIRGFFLWRQPLVATGFDNTANRKPGAVARESTPYFEGLWQCIHSRGQAAVGKHHPVKPVGHFCHYAQAHQRTPVLPEKSHVLEIVGLHPSLHPLHMVEVGIVRRLFQLVGSAETHQIGHDHPHACGHKNRNHLAVQKRPGWFAMHQQYQRAIARAFVDMCDPQNTHLGVSGLVGEIRQVGKPGFGRAQHVAVDRQGDGLFHKDRAQALRCEGTTLHHTLVLGVSPSRAWDRANARCAKRSQPVWFTGC